MGVADRAAPVPRRAWRPTVGEIAMRSLSAALHVCLHCWRCWRCWRCWIVACWMLHAGDIEFDRVSIAYKDGGDPVLHGLRVAIRSCEKIGVVGRTGAGALQHIATCCALVVRTAAQRVGLRCHGCYIVRCVATRRARRPLSSATHAQPRGRRASAAWRMFVAPRRRPAPQRSTRCNTAQHCNDGMGWPLTSQASRR